MKNLFIALSPAKWRVALAAISCVTVSAFADVVVTEVRHAEIDCWKIETPTTTYLFDKVGGGLAEMFDSEGKGWIKWNWGQGWSGINRGIPNMVWEENGQNFFHPGHTGDKASVCTYEKKDGIATITCVSANGAWETVWEFFETHARMTVTKVNGNYWFLYEGLPGGELDENDWYMLSNGTKAGATVRSEIDIPSPEWIVWGDDNVEHVLFLTHSPDDDAGDFNTTTGTMTIFGFGRSGESYGFNKGLHRVGDQFCVGFLKTKDHRELSTRIEAIMTGTTAGKKN